MSTSTPGDIAGFVPVSREQAAALRAGDDLGDLVAYAPGPALRAAHGLGPGRRRGGRVRRARLRRARSPARRTRACGRSSPSTSDGGQVEASGSEFGQVQVHGLTWAQVVGRVRRRARRRARPRGRAGAGRRARPLADVADDEEVVGLVDRWDLLWYAPAELDASAG